MYSLNESFPDYFLTVFLQKKLLPSLGEKVDLLSVSISDAEEIRPGGNLAVKSYKRCFFFGGAEYLQS